MKRQTYLWRPPLLLYARAQAILARKRGQGERTSLQTLLVDLLTRWVYLEEHRWTALEDNQHVDL